ncbi:DUF1826 domain-containing protein [Halobaculum marinum]|uniref:DUF1826 domain-containing protein n=1 Tax=Halobaculum marinum TaxID=3031996 RepID=UPI003D80C37F
MHSALVAPEERLDFVDARLRHVDTRACPRFHVDALRGGDSRGDAHTSFCTGGALYASHAE